MVLLLKVLNLDMVIVFKIFSLKIPKKIIFDPKFKNFNFFHAVLYFEITAKNDHAKKLASKAFWVQKLKLF